MPSFRWNHGQGMRDASPMTLIVVLMSIAVLSFSSATLPARGSTGSQVPGLPPQPLPVGNPPGIAIVGTGNTCVRLLLDNLQVRFVTARFSYPGLPAGTMDFRLDTTLSGIFGIPTDTDFSITFPSHPDAKWLGEDQKEIGKVRLPKRTIQVQVPIPPPPPKKKPPKRIDPDEPPEPPEPPPVIRFKTETREFIPSRDVPYSDCYTTSVRLPRTPPDQLQQMGTIVFLNHFNAAPLTYPGAPDPAALEDIAKKYYGMRDPPPMGSTSWTKSHNTLGEFWTQARFGPNGTAGTEGVYASAAYLDYALLGVGKDVHMLRRKVGTDPKEWTFSYMTLYGAPDQDLGNADLAAKRNQALGKYTLAMEHNPNATVPEDIVTFWIFDGGTDKAKLVASANLDGLGERYAPGLCLNCHGDHDFNGDGTGRRGTFIPFSTDGFRYAGRAKTLPAGQIRSFYQLNQLVYWTDPAPAHRTLLETWYREINLANSTPTAPNTSAIPSAWTGSREFYQQVNAPYCRSCHHSLDVNNTLTTFDAFANYVTNEVVCRSFYSQNKEMPHSLFAYRGFWLSGVTKDIPQQVGLPYWSGKVSSMGFTCQ